MNAAQAVEAAMSEAQYEAERARIEAEYQQHAAQGAAKTAIKERALAELFERSGWTQEQLAKKEGKSRVQIQRQLCFGRFLRIVPNGNNSEKPAFLIPIDLNERRFRDYWDQTKATGDPDERFRFRRVMELMREDIEEVGPIVRFKRKASTLPDKPAQAILSRFADGKWHTPEQIAEGIGAATDDVRAKLTQMKSTCVGKCHYETRKYGKGSQYRIVKGGERQVNVTALQKEIEPLLKALFEEGKKNAATVSPAAVAQIANQIEKAIEKLAR